MIDISLLAEWLSLLGTLILEGPAPTALERDLNRQVSDAVVVVGCLCARPELTHWPDAGQPHDAR
ncbi:MAG TPA: hypothetical protein VFU98_13500 [Microlunatus sp.]|nr:hypothetical protein [Microlunatus sp.]